MPAVDTRPVCGYAAKCTRRNPLHFQHFRHPEQHPWHVPASGDPGGGRCRTTASPMSPTSASAVAMAADAVGDACGRCKFGCGRVRKEDRDSRYDTCCRACAIGQGSGNHDSGCPGGEVVMAKLVEESHEAAVDTETTEETALMLLDLSLEIGALMLIDQALTPHGAVGDARRREPSSAAARGRSCGRERKRERAATDECDDSGYLEVSASWELLWP